MTFLCFFEQVVKESKTVNTATTLKQSIFFKILWYVDFTLLNSCHYKVKVNTNIDEQQNALRKWK